MGKWPMGRCDSWYVRRRCRRPIGHTEAHTAYNHVGDYVEWVNDPALDALIDQDRTLHGIEWGKRALSGDQVEVGALLRSEVVEV